MLALLPIKLNRNSHFTRSNSFYRDNPPSFIEALYQALQDAATTQGRPVSRHISPRAWPTRVWANTGWYLRAFDAYRATLNLEAPGKLCHCDGSTVSRALQDLGVSPVSGQNASTQSHFDQKNPLLDVALMRQVLANPRIFRR